MSRIGKQPVQIPSGVEMAVNARTVSVKGPKGQLTRTFHPAVSIAVSNGVATVSVKDETDKLHRSLWGLSQRLLANMVMGVQKGMQKQLELNGVGFRASVAGSTLTLNVGFSHPVEFHLPDGIAAAVEKNVITITGIDKELVGEIAAQIRKIRKPEPYKGKGIRYVGEVVRKKAGKAAKAGAK